MHDYSSSPSVTHSIFWGDSAPAGPEIYDDVSSGASSIMTHSDVLGGRAGTRNIDVAPLYVDADGADEVAGTSDDDLRLRPGSPCIDAANGATVPPFDKDGNPRYDDPDTPNAGVGAVSYADLAPTSSRASRSLSAGARPPRAVGRLRACGRSRFPLVLLCALSFSASRSGDGGDSPEIAFEFRCMRRSSSLTDRTRSTNNSLAVEMDCPFPSEAGQSLRRAQHGEVGQAA